MPRGGKRKGAGRPSGTTGIKHAATLEKEASAALQRQIILERIRPLTEAQIDNALGVKYLVVRNKATGKFERLEAADLAVRGESDKEVIEVYEKDPNVNAFKELMERTFGKAPQSVQLDATVRSDAEALAILNAGLARATDG